MHVHSSTGDSDPQSLTSQGGSVALKLAEVKSR